jgi:hypothetical protein
MALERGIKKLPAGVAFATIYLSANDLEESPNEELFLFKEFDDHAIRDGLGHKCFNT